MASNFHFAFWGPQHSYFASVTRVLASGHPLEPSDTASYVPTPCIDHLVLRRPFRYSFRLPESFSIRHGTNASKRYISNIRGHDFLSHTGRWTDGNGGGLVDATFNSLGEIHALTLLAKENRDNGYREADLKISLGPLPGSFFADAYRLNRYRWANLPGELENELQKEVGRRSYGKIVDVAMNATGGWVIQLDEGDTTIGIGRMFGRPKEVMHFRFGGSLPMELKEALKEGHKRLAKIIVWWLSIFCVYSLADNNIIACIPQSPASRRIRATLQRWPRSC